MKTALLFLLLFPFFNVYAQTGTPPATVWTKTYGGPGDDYANNVLPTGDGGFVYCGTTTAAGGDVLVSKGSTDTWITKVNSAGVIEWQNTIGGSLLDNLYRIRQTPDGGYIAAGFSASNDQDVSGHHGSTSTDDAWVVKLSSTGNIQWQKSLGGTHIDRALDASPTADGGYITVGYTYSSDGDVSGYHGGIDAWVVKLSSSGAIQWQRCYGGTLEENLKVVEQLPNGDYLLTGFSRSTNGDLTGVPAKGGADYWVLRINSTGVIQWQKKFGGTLDDIMHTMCFTSDGGIAVGGLSASLDGDVNGTFTGYNAWIIKMDNTGTLLWSSVFGGSGSESIFDAVPANDGGVVVAGYTMSADGTFTGYHHGTTATRDGFAARISGSGTLIWNKNYGGTADDDLRCVIELSGGGYMIAGTAASNDNDVLVNKGGIDQFVIRLAADVLPVKISAFTALAAGATHVLRWTTATEVNTDRFEIERSANGILFKHIGNVRAGTGEYRFEDLTSLKGKNYYRLKAVDKDGSYNYSEIRMLENKGDISARIFPNPVRDALQLQLSNVSAGSISYSVVSVDGRKLLSAVVRTEAGTARAVINTANLPAGNYYLYIVQDNRLPVQISFVKQ